MSQVNALLGVLQTHKGDELILESGQAPTYLDHGKVLNLFLRAIGPGRHSTILDELVTGEARQTLESDGSVTFPYDAAERGQYTVFVTGRGERIRFAAVVTEPEVPELPDATEVPGPQPSSPPLPVAQATAPPTAASPVLDTHQATPSDGLVQLLAYAAERGASDLHLATGGPPTLRSNGRLQPLGDRPADTDALVGSLLSSDDRTQLACGGSLDRAIEIPGGTRFRANIYRHAEGLAAAFRVLRPAPPPLSRLNLPVDLSWIPALNHGLVLFTGPTGSGKSTTMASLVRHLLETRGGLLITLEDPIEYRFDPTGKSLVRQREIGRHVVDFPTGLRDALREDPDVLLVGEMRDVESIRLALTAAETGHLVLASLHSRSAPAAVERIVDAYPAERQRQIRVQLADALRGVVAQRLLPRADGAGRVPAVEVLRNTPAAANCIREGKTPQLVSIMQTGLAEGMIPMDKCIEKLVQAGRVAARDADR